MEMIVSIILLTILAGLIYTNLAKAKERALGKEAIANLELIAVAQKSYYIDYGSYYISTNVSNINSNLHLFFNETSWNYDITTSGGDTFTATAVRNGSGGYLDCVYSITQAQSSPVDNGSCP